MSEKVINSYYVKSENIKVKVEIKQVPGEFTLIYNLAFPKFDKATRALIDDVKTNIVATTPLPTGKLLDAKLIMILKKEFREKAETILDKEIPDLEANKREFVLAIIINEMLGLGPIEFMLNDIYLEDIVVNSPDEPVWTYHKSYGWLKTNLSIPENAEIQNYASIIARRVGRQITNLDPILDAHLITGDRANATLSPVSSEGNTLTIRRFRREPWTIVDFIKNKTLNSEVAALIWFAMESEMNIIISGGTASGKTSLLNVCLPFIQPNHRIVSIEDTRELQLPKFLHWVPLVTREPNPEGKGEVSMLDLLVTSLRMRPDRIVLGEVRRENEAQVMFEAMHTGHAVYSTVHANTSNETLRRITSPPINIPVQMMEAVNMNIVMFRNRRTGIRRIIEIAELIPEREEIRSNILYRWRSAEDNMESRSDSIRLMDDLALHNAMTKVEIATELEKKKMVLDWLVKRDYRDMQTVGSVTAQYYMDPQKVISAAKNNAELKSLK